MDSLEKLVLDDPALLDDPASRSVVAHRARYCRGSERRGLRLDRLSSSSRPDVGDCRRSEHRWDPGGHDEGHRAAVYGRPVKAEPDLLTYRLPAGSVRVFVIDGRVESVDTESGGFVAQDRAVHVGAKPHGKMWHGFVIDGCGGAPLLRFYIGEVRGIDTLLWVGLDGRVNEIQVSTPGPWCDSGQ